MFQCPETQLLRSSRFHHQNKLQQLLSPAEQQCDCEHTPGQQLFRFKKQLCTLWQQLLRSTANLHCCLLAAAFAFKSTAVLQYSCILNLVESRTRSIF
jgi:hypothetical protein